MDFAILDGKRTDEIFFSSCQHLHQSSKNYYI